MDEDEVLIKLHFFIRTSKFAVEAETSKNDISSSFRLGSFTEEITV